MKGKKEAKRIREEAKICIDHAKCFVEEGIQQILNDELDEGHGVSVSPGATALASLSLLALGKGYEKSLRAGVNWLVRHQGELGWGKVPGGAPDPEITRIARMVIQASRGGLLSKLSLIEQVKQLSDLVLTVGHDVIPGLQGPSPEEICLPNVLERNVFEKLPSYGRPVVIAAALLATQNDHQGIAEGIQFIRENQLPDGSWAEDIVATSLCIMALFRFNNLDSRIHLAGKWLTRKQYSSGGWPAFDQLKIWTVGWSLALYGNTRSIRLDLLQKAFEWLVQAGNQDGSYGTTPPFTHPDLDDTAIALMALPVDSPARNSTIELLYRLQNEDGSWGTFPSFDGQPPRIESHQPVYIQSLDVTVHVIEAMSRHGIQDQKILNAIRWLISQQKKDGQFQSVWFEGPIYGTAQVIDLMSRLNFGWSKLRLARQLIMAHQKGVQFLLRHYNSEGNWGNSAAETALAMWALKQEGACLNGLFFDQAVQSILARQNEAGSFLPAYQGIYAKGWNYEEPISTALTVIRALDWYVAK